MYYLFCFLFIFYLSTSNASVAENNSTENLGLILNTKARDKMHGELQIVSEKSFYISNLYRSGSYLIYDCQKGYYACVNKDSFEFCE